MKRLLKVGTTSPRLMQVDERTWKNEEGHKFKMRELEEVGNSFRTAIIDKINDSVIFVSWI